MEKTKVAQAVAQAVKEIPAPAQVELPLPAAPVATPAAPVVAAPQVKIIRVPAKPAEPLEKVDLAENPRNIAMREIVKGYKERVDIEAQETFPVTDDDGNVVSPVKEPVAEPEPEQEEEPAAEEAAPAALETAAAPVVAAPQDPKAIDPNLDYEVTVDGQKVKVKGSKIIDAGFRTFQKETAADYRLQLATSMLDEARKTAAQAQPPAQAGAQPQAPAAGAVQIDDAQLAEAIQFGTKEQAAEALKLLRQKDPTTVNMEGLQQFMAQQLPGIVNGQLAFREAANFAKTEYGDLLADPYLKELFLMREDTLRKAGDQRPPAELYKAIGDDIRTHFNRPKAAAPTSHPQPQSMAQRKEAKANAPAAPRLAAARLEAGADAAKPKTAQDIIAQMRVRRGQGQLNRI